MGRFLTNAVEIFEAAKCSLEAGHDLSDMTIVLGPGGGVNLLADCDWPLDSLQAHRGAGMVYRVSQRDNSVRLEGRAGFRTCLFEAAKPNGAARRLLADTPTGLLYRVNPVPVLASPLTNSVSTEPA